MLFDADGRATIYEAEADLRRFPGWQLADIVTRTRILEAAFQYSLTGHDEPSKWLGKDILYYPAMAAYRALLLLLNETPTALSSLSEEVWQRWAPIIATFDVMYDAESQPQHKMLVRLAYQFAPQELLNAIMVEVHHANQKLGRHFDLWRFEYCWDHVFSSTIVTLLRMPQLHPHCLQELLGAALEHQAFGAQEFARQLLTQQLIPDQVDFKKALIAATLLIDHCADGDWSTVWPLMQKCSSFGRELMLGYAHMESRSENTLVGKLTERSLADLFNWLVKEFPYSGDPRHNDGDTFHTVTPRDDVGYLRDSIIGVLQRRGNFAAVAELEKILDLNPDLAWIRWKLIEARISARQGTWLPLDLNSLHAFVSCHDARIIENGKQLLNVLVEILVQMGAELHAETPTVFRLWNEGKGYTPKNEERFSDEIKHYLQRKLSNSGVVVNREVVIRPTVKPSFQGQRTDIKVEAVRGGENGIVDTITAIIEVKGCWNPGLKADMEIQLRDRYLRDNTCQYGLYVVGWFVCCAWANEYRKRNVPPMSLSEAREYFEAQAESLSSTTVLIKSYVMDTSLMEDCALQDKD